MRVVFFGTPAFAAEFLQALLDDPAMEVVGVVAQPDEPVGRKNVLTPPATKVLAMQHALPVLQPTKLKDADFATKLVALQADVFVVVAYGRIIPQVVLDIPALGCVNVHPSLLPALRGPSPMQAAIAEQHAETGVTIMLLDAEMDHGPILAQERIPLSPTATYPWLADAAVRVGAPLLLATLTQYAAKRLVPHAQSHEAATFCGLLSRKDGLIDWHQPADVIDAHIRAYNPWPGTATTWLRNGQQIALKIFSARKTDVVLPPGTVHIDADRLLVGTATTALSVQELQPAAGKRMDAAAFLHGYRDIEGATLGS